MFGWRSTTQDEFNAEKARLLKAQQLCEHGSSVAQTKPGLGVPGTIMASVVSPPPLHSAGLDADAIAVSDVKYCSDSDQVKVTVKDKTVPFPISAILSKVACVSNTVVV